MNQHPIALLIETADKAINREDFDTVVDLYAKTEKSLCWARSESSYDPLPNPWLHETAFGRP